VDQRELWGHLGWQDIKQRYRRSVIGPLWITISMAVTAAALGGLYSQQFGQPIGTFMPYVTVGFMIWYFISACVLEGTETFIANEGLIRFLPAPLMIYVFRTVWRQILFFAHNVVVYVIVLAIFFRQLDKPDGRHEGPINTSVGVQWGIFIAFLLGALLAYSGYRVRAAHVPEPVEDGVAPRQRRPRPPAPPTDPPPSQTQATAVARRRPARPGDEQLEGQLSFDEPAEYRPPPR
jgi:hypothetical protein